MSKNMVMAEGVFGRCDTCVRNLFRSICDFTCAPDQSRFMAATDTGENEKGTFVESIEVNLFFL